MQQIWGHKTKMNDLDFDEVEQLMEDPPLSQAVKEKRDTLSDEKPQTKRHDDSNKTCVGVAINVDDVSEKRSHFLYDKTNEYQGLRENGKDVGKEKSAMKRTNSRSLSRSSRCSDSTSSFVVSGRCNEQNSKDTISKDRKRSVGENKADTHREDTFGKSEELSRVSKSDGHHGVCDKKNLSGFKNNCNAEGEYKEQVKMGYSEKDEKIKDYNETHKEDPSKFLVDRELKGDKHELTNDTCELKYDSRECRNDSRELKIDSRVLKNEDRELKNENRELKNENRESKNDNRESNKENRDYKHDRDSRHIRSDRDKDRDRSDRDKGERERGSERERERDRERDRERERDRDSRFGARNGSRGECRGGGDYRGDYRGQESWGDAWSGNMRVPSSSSYGRMRRSDGRMQDSYGSSSQRRFESRYGNYSGSRRTTGRRDPPLSRTHARSSSRSRRRSPRPANEKTTPSTVVPTVEDPQARKQRAEELLKKEVEEARRDDLTVLVLNLALRAEERHIYEFFSANAGKIRDIQLIRDQRSGSSKGVAYCEFYTQEAVIKAMALNGINFKGQPLRVQASMAEKNRAARAAKLQQQLGPDNSAVNIPMRVYIGNLVGLLSKISKEDIQALFTPFGPITSVVLPHDEMTGENLGFGFVTFGSVSDAHDAMQHMHNTEISGQMLRVGYAADGVRGSNSMVQQALLNASTVPGTLGLHHAAGTGVTAASVSTEAKLAAQLAAQLRGQRDGLPSEEADGDGEHVEDQLDEEDSGFIHDPTKKQALMQQLLNRSAQQLLLAHTEPPQIRTDQTFLKGSNGVKFGSLGAGVITSRISLKNLFNPKELSKSEDPDFFSEVCEDVREECVKFGTVLDVKVNPVDPDGRVWLSFETPSMAQGAFTALNGRYFAGRKINAEFVTEAMMKTVVSETTPFGEDPS